MEINDKTELEWTLLKEEYTLKMFLKLSNEKEFQASFVTFENRFQNILISKSKGKNVMHTVNRHQYECYEKIILGEYNGDWGDYLGTTLEEQNKWFEKLIFTKDERSFLRLLESAVRRKAIGIFEELDFDAITKILGVKR